MTPQPDQPALDPLAFDRYDAYLFDIDGTLLQQSDAVHYFAFCEVLSAVAGSPLNLDGIVAHGNTDVGILRDAFTHAGVDDTRWRPELPAIQQAMGRFVHERQADLRIEVLPGVVDLLHRLRAGGAVLGVATGNLAGIGTIKLQHAGLAALFDFAAFSDAHEYRRDVFAAALEQARQRTHPEARVCVVGDTPEDVRAAHANGLDVVAVATGIFSRQQLKAERPTWCVDTLQDLADAATTRADTASRT